MVERGKMGNAMTQTDAVSVADQTDAVPASRLPAGIKPPAVMVPVLPTGDAILPLLREMDERHVYSNDGPLNQRFAAALADLLQSRLTTPARLHVATVSNGTVAIELALRLRARRGRFVIMPAYTFIATAQAVTNAGFEPWFTDVDADNWALTPEIAQELIARLPELPAAIVAVSPFGAPIDQRAWNSFEEKTGIPVVLDMAAAALSLDGVGRVPACVSLHATKMLGIGEGGAIVSEDADLIAAARSASSFGFEPGTRLAARRGGNHRISEYAAAVGLTALAHAAEKEFRLKALAKAYRHHLGDAPIDWHAGFGERWVSMTINIGIPAKHVNAVTAGLDERSIPWRRWWSRGCHTHPPFATAPRERLDVTDDLGLRIIGLPFHELLTDDQIALVSETVRKGVS
ncbi:DegT/DnrJ/EryC1/StrS family aminotransferase [Candidatus Raskinella chloraquaticus]|uniref:DegT/DnrJ/EryC1/StrS family aminotransferase n=2 Tax=Candidatus Raskinella chloraquaticus TaxID=1951219 RepID=UPI00366CCF9C